MITASGITIQFTKEPLFKDVNVSFTPGNCYGLIGANGSGKSTFLKVLSGEIEPSAGEIIIPKGKRLSVLKQDHFAYDEFAALETVVMGHKRIWEIMQQKDALYAKADFTDADGIKLGELDEEFNELGGWSIDAEAAKLLSDLGIPESLHAQKMQNLEAGVKVRVLLAQALVGNPDILLLDEPTNHLDLETAMWLEDFLDRFENTAVVISHDRHFLDNVCTHIADIDFGEVRLYSGNYTFWSESSKLLMRQKQDKNKKVEEQRKELQEFILRFSANLSKARQATSRKKQLEKLNLEEIKPSSRRYPYVEFKFEKQLGNDILEINGLGGSHDGEPLFKDFSLKLRKGDKVAFLGKNDRSKTALFETLLNKAKADGGTFRWGETAQIGYFPKDFGPYFTEDMPIIRWLGQYAESKDDTFFRSFLGKMLFSGDDVFKSVKVLSGGEKVRCQLSRLMLQGANVLVLDEPTNHLDLESITSLNEGLERFQGVLLISSHDHQLLQSVANRVVEIAPNGYLDKIDHTLDEFLASDKIKEQRAALYG
jgi:ATPase subunit of ABC transporter with duplicated ATPase domains